MAHAYIWSLSSEQRTQNEGEKNLFSRDAKWTTSSSLWPHYRESQAFVLRSVLQQSFFRQPFIMVIQDCRNLTSYILHLPSYILHLTSSIIHTSHTSHLTFLIIWFLFPWGGLLVYMLLCMSMYMCMDIYNHIPVNPLTGIETKFSKMSNVRCEMYDVRCMM